MRLRVPAPVAAALAAVAVLAAGCAGTAAGPVQSPSPEGPAVSPSASPSPSAPGPTELTIVADDGAGRRTTWRLTCDPAGGDHPDPDGACAILAAQGELALPPTRKDMACTQVYGGPDRATVTGTWRGAEVASSFSRTDGCEISRWDLMQPLLPPAGT